MTHYLIRTDRGDFPYPNRWLAIAKLPWVAMSITPGTSAAALVVTEDGEHALAVCERDADGRVCPTQHLE